MQSGAPFDTDTLEISISDLVKPEALATRSVPRREHQTKRADKTNRDIGYSVRLVSQWHEVRFGSSLPDPGCNPPSERVLVGYMFDHLDLLMFGPHLFDESVDLQAAVERQQAVLEELAARGFRDGTALPTPATLEQTIRRLQLAYENVDRSAYQAPMVKVLRKLLKAEAEAARVTMARAQPLIGENLNAILATCDRTHLGLRDRALILFVLSVGEFTASGISKVRIEQLNRQPDGTYVVDIDAAELKPRHSKIGLSALLEGDAARAMDAWLNASKIVNGAVFCGTTRRKVFISKSTKETTGLSHQTCQAMIAARAADAGLKGNFHWSSFHLTAPTVRAADGSRASPRSWKLQNRIEPRSGLKPVPQPVVVTHPPTTATGSGASESTAPQLSTAPPAVDDPVLVLVDQTGSYMSYDFKFSIEGVPFTATWGAWVRLALRDSRTTVGIADTVLDGDALEDTSTHKQLSLEALSPTARAGLAKLFGVLPVGSTSKRERRIDSFLSSPAGKQYRIWADFVSWDGPEQDPRLTSPHSVFAQWLNAQNDSPTKAAMRCRRYEPPSRRR